MVMVSDVEEVLRMEELSPALPFLDELTVVGKLEKVSFSPEPNKLATALI